MILCCGEALIDMLPRKTAAGEDAFAPYPGGAVFNTAIALGRLGARVGFFSGLSRDLFGQRLMAALEEAGVDHSLAAISDRPTTLAFVTLKDGHASYAFYDENTAGRMLGEGDLPELPASVTALFFGGISLVAEPCGSAYEVLMLRAAKDGRLTMIDPNIRPGFITDETAYRARLARLLAVADIVKLSDEDLRWLEGAGEVSDLAGAILARGPKLVLITEGASGARAFTRRGALHVPAEAVEVVDTVGAGDTFNAGVLAGLEREGMLSRQALADATDEALERIVGLGIRAAAVTVSRAGANPPYASELGL
ncbi:fructokinase [Meinhardsimonia xiamenensis]|jgi:fructokinase|uniref:Fructokinase n=1 Tax=Meinhardsimonia xiamenensis TaxID=990712 RepID=A0A1G8YWN7_9RHOB|nr:carbohydrate kinase [Meinhardsimonia xiamenensis]PRX37467.1 fructokinase [Meinhardsimonia xiamenensis]SDK07272.1 fructokinase [Meinhardsimonia xiamenensis]